MQSLPTTEKSQLDTRQNQLIELQSQLMFMEATLDTLNDIVIQQSQQIADQQRQIQLLYQKSPPCRAKAKFSRLTCWRIDHRIINNQFYGF